MNQWLNKSVIQYMLRPQKITIQIVPAQHAKMALTPSFLFFKLKKWTNVQIALSEFELQILCLMNFSQFYLEQFRRPNFSKYIHFGFLTVCISCCSVNLQLGCSGHVFWAFGVLPMTHFIYHTPVKKTAHLPEERMVIVFIFFYVALDTYST